MSNDLLGAKVVPFLFLAAILLIVSIAVGTAIEENKWEDFKINHKCKIISHADGSFSSGIGITSTGGVGAVSIYNPEKTQWTCDDKISYWE